MITRFIKAFIFVGTAACSAEMVETAADIYDTAYIGSDGDYELFQGYVGGMFEITVDGVKYPDSEEWYNSEMDKIPERLTAAGYEGVDFNFNAEVGLDDFWNNTKVNVASSGSTGYQGSSTVESVDGSFEIRLPQGSFGNYQIKSVKRLNLTLPNGDIFCYNMKGIEKSYTLNAFTDPIIVDSFVTSITKYDCGSTDTNGILVEPELNIGQKLVKGMTRDEVNESIGSPWQFEMSTSSTSPTHTWYYPEYYSGNVPSSANGNSKTYSCKLVFKKVESTDDDVVLSTNTNCNDEVIDIVNW
jgi:hypothetical protein